MVSRSARPKTKKTATAKKKARPRTTTKKTKPRSLAKTALYAGLVVQLRSLLKGEYDFIANASNFTSLLYHYLPDVNWAGFYFLHEKQLVLGPFQGRPACVRIPVGSGVCGVAAAQCETIIVPNVHEFPGHIACDTASNSEIVVPIFDGERLLGVLDVDSPSLGRFDDQDAEGLNELVTVLIAHEEKLDD